MIFHSCLNICNTYCIIAEVIFHIKRQPMKLHLSWSLSFTISIIIISTTKSFGQSSSVLQRYMDANPLIQNNQYFQKAQDELDKAAYMPLGLELPVTDILTDLKTIVSQWRINDIKLETTGDSVAFTFSLNNGIKSEKFSTQRMPKFGSFGGDLKPVFITMCNQMAEVLSRNMKGSKHPEMINFAMTELYAYIDPSPRTREITDNTIFKENVARFLVNVLDEKLKEAPQFKQILISAKLTDSFINAKALPEITVFLNDKLDIVKQNVSNGLDNVISTAGEFQKKAGNVLASANTGISVSNKESDLGAGFSFTFGGKQLGKNKNTSYKITGIVNGLFSINSSDTLSSQPFITGLQISLANKDVFQANFIGAFVLDNPKQGKAISGNNSGELGVGILLKPTDNLIIGANMVYKFYQKTIVLDNGTRVSKANQISVGITIQQAKSNSPIYMIGFAKNDMDSKSFTPTMQIIYPLVLNK